MRRALKLLSYISLVFGIALFTIPGYGQGRGPLAPKNAYTFPPQAQRVVDRLATFSTVPDQDWLYHAGNVPHGERPDLDTSDWQTVKLPILNRRTFRSASFHPFTASAGAVWFRRWVVVPKTVNGYDISGSQVWIRIYARSGGRTILYLNGSRVALGVGLAKQLLFSNAKPGDKILVAVKLMGPHTKKVYGFPLSVVYSSHRPNPVALRDELLSASYLLPAITKDPVKLASQEKTLDAAATSVDLSALDHDNPTAFDASLRKAQATLEALRPALQKYTIQMTGNSHMDAAWLWPWTETVHVVRHTLGTALQLMNEYPGYTFSQSAAQYFNWMQQKYPPLFKQIQQRVKEGRFELVGGMWAEPDLNLPDGETTVREVLYGKRYFEKNFGVNIRVGWNPDTFGYNWQLPQIYKKAGIDYFVTQKMAWNDTNQLPLKLFWWQSPDGSRVLTYFPHGYGNPIRPVNMANQLATAVQLNPGQHEMMHLYGVGDHGGGPTRDMLDSGKRWMRPNKVYPDAEFGTAITFFKKMSKLIDTADAPVWNYETLAAGDTKLSAPPQGEISLPVWNDELYLEFHRGTYTTQAKQKWYLRHAPEWMESAEKYSSLAWLGGLNYPDAQLTHAWETIMFNTNHDLAAGSGIGIIYKDATKQFRAVHFTANAATHNALSDIDSHIDTKSRRGVPILIWNPLSWNRSDVVEANVQMPEAEPNGISVLDAHGRPVLMQILSKDDATHSYHLLLKVKNVPSIGYTVLHAVPGARKVATDLKVHGMTLENSRLRVVIDPKNGCISSLYDKRDHFESLVAGSCGNILQAYVNKPKQYDAWNINPNYVNHGTNLTMADSVKVIERGPLRSEIQIKRHWSKSTFVQNVILYAGMDRVDLVNDVDWHESHIFLKAGFQLAASAPKATFEIPYGTIERPTTRNNSVQKAKFEVSAQRWADEGDGQHGFSLINDSKYGYDVKGDVMQLSLLRSPKSPDPNADMGEQHFRYSLYPHAGTWRQANTVQHAYAFNIPMRAMQVDAHTGELPPSHSFVTIKPDNLIVSAMKKSEDGNSLILRFYEWAGKKATADITVPDGVSSATEANLLENTEGSPLSISGDHIMMPAGRYSINTVRVNFGDRGAEFWQAQK